MQWSVSGVSPFSSDYILAHHSVTDVLNTREVVSVRSLSSALSFFDKMNAVLNEDVLSDVRKGVPIDEHKIVPIHVILGNHDMNLCVESDQIQ